MYYEQMSKMKHDFKKQNLVTLPSSKGGYDLLKCSKCGIIGKTHQLGMVELKGSYSKNKVENCTETKEEMKSVNTGKSIQITQCRATGTMFENLEPESIHEVIETPENETIDNKGVWVVGVGCPVKVLNDEFNFVI